MTGYDVVVIGAGAAGLSAGALLATEGKRVLVADRSPVLGGRPWRCRTRLQGQRRRPSHRRSRIRPDQGHQGPHRDPVLRARPLGRQEPAAVAAPVHRRPGRYRPVRVHHRAGVHDRPVVGPLGQRQPLRPQDALLRAGHRRLLLLAGQGWDGMWADLSDAITSHGGELRLGTAVERVVIENHEVKGVAVARQPRVLPNEFFEEEIIEAPCVISTLPVWHVLKVVPEDELPDWYAGQIKYLAQDRFRIAWLGLYLAVDEPVPVLDRLELSTWLHTPTARISGFFFEQTALDPTTAPAGKYLYVMGGIIPGAKGRDRRYIDEKFDQFESDIGVMYPGLAKPSWRRRHLVFEPSFGVIQKPGLVGMYRPHWRAPNADGLYFASEPFRSRGIGFDRA